MNEPLPEALPLPPLVADVAEWLSEKALGEFEHVSLLEEFCHRVAAIGVPLERGHISFRTLHPLFDAMSCTWWRGIGCETEEMTHQEIGYERSRWTESPLRHLIDTRVPMMRRRLTGPDALLDYPVLEEFRDEGLTDWIGFVIAFDEAGHDGMVSSWSTRRSGGFSDTHLTALKFLQRPFAVAIKIAAQEAIAGNVVHTYLGPVAGKRVLDGQIKRGDGETIPAVIWYSDLRGSTQMAEKLGRDGYTAVLNAYFEAMGGAISDAGGEILDFIGDAVLAIFPIGDTDATTACERALAAARDAEMLLAETNRQRKSQGAAPLAFGLALHRGEVMFGNIGTADRLTFSVIGSSVNEVARLQDMTKELGAHMLVSGAFADTLDRPWHELGEHNLTGVGQPMRILTLPETESR
jgi:adenylate cyclase